MLLVACVLSFAPAWAQDGRILLANAPFIRTALSPDGMLVAGSARDRKVHLWRVSDGQEAHALDVGDIPVAVAFSGDNRRLAALDRTGTVTLWDASTFEVIRSWPAQRRGSLGLAFSADARWLATSDGGTDTVVRVWDVGTGELRSTLRHHIGGIAGLAFSPDGTVLASVSDDTTVVLSEWRSGTVIRRFDDSLMSQVGIVWSADGRILVVVGADKLVRVYDAASGALRTAFSGHKDMLWSVAIAPDGDLIATGEGNDFSAAPADIRLWNARTGESVAVLRGHEDTINLLAFTPDGRTLVSSSTDRTIRAWPVGPAVP